MSHLENERVKLRAIEPEDIDLLYSWENNTAIWQVSGTLKPYSKHVLIQYISEAHKDIYEQKQLRLVIEAKGNGENHAVGLIDLFDIDFYNQRSGIGILIANDSERRKGYATDALCLTTAYGFEVLNLHQLYCNVAAGNAESIGLFTKAGFEQAGLLKEWLKISDGWHDVITLQRINNTQ